MIAKNLPFYSGDLRYSFPKALLLFGAVQDEVLYFHDAVSLVLKCNNELTMCDLVERDSGYYMLPGTIRESSVRQAITSRHIVRKLRNRT